MRTRFCLPSPALLLLLLTLGVSTKLLAGALSWETLSVSRQTNNAETEVVLDFPFENKGPGQVKITGLRSGCDCATPRLSKDHYAPGEKGVLQMVFTIGYRTGRQERTVLVETDETPRSTTELRLRVDITELLPVKPKLVFWAKDEACTEKAITLSPVEPASTRILSITCEEEGFEVRREEPADTGLIRLWVKPTKTADYAQTRIRVRYAYKDKELETSAFVAVR